MYSESARGGLKKIGQKQFRAIFFWAENFIEANHYKTDAE